jgi:guanyl-specific ribonuclease Sa
MNGMVQPVETSVHANTTYESMTDLERASKAATQDTYDTATGAVVPAGKKWESVKAAKAAKAGSVKTAKEAKATSVKTAKEAKATGVVIPMESRNAQPVPLPAEGGPADYRQDSVNSGMSSDGVYDMVITEQDTNYTVVHDPNFVYKTTNDTAPVEKAVNVNVNTAYVSMTDLERQRKVATQDTYDTGTGAVIPDGVKGIHRTKSAVALAREKFLADANDNSSTLPKKPFLSNKGAKKTAPPPAAFATAVEEATPYGYLPVDANGEPVDKAEEKEDDPDGCLLIAKDDS